MHFTDGFIVLLIIYVICVSLFGCLEKQNEENRIINVNFTKNTNK